jgi:hypothetical protein
LAIDRVVKNLSKKSWTTRICKGINKENKYLFENKFRSSIELKQNFDTAGGSLLLEELWKLSFKRQTYL